MFRELNFAVFTSDSDCVYFLLHHSIITDGFWVWNWLFFSFFFKFVSFKVSFCFFFVLFFIKIWRFAHLTSIILHRFLKSLGKDEIWVLVGMVLMKWIYSLNIFALIWWFFVRGASNLSRMAKNVMFSFFSKLNRKQA